MKKRKPILNSVKLKLVLLWLLLIPCLQLNAVPKIIFDSDIAGVNEDGKDRSDIDDLSALVLLNALTNMDKCEILCIVTNTRSDQVVDMIDAVNTYYDNPNIPIGIKGGSSDLIKVTNSYSKIIAENYKHKQKSANALSATEVLRRVLSSISESDTVIYIHADVIAYWETLCIGSLLESSPDEISTLSGWELLNAKVDKFVSYIPCLPNNNVAENCPDWANRVATNPVKVANFIENYQNELIGNTTAIMQAHLPTRLLEQSDDHPLKVAFNHYYTQTPPPWHGSNEVPNEISIYGDGLGIIYTVLGESVKHVFAYHSQGNFEISDEHKLRWTSKDMDNRNGYFYPLPQYKAELWKKLDELICYKPKK
jgi:hypothetical protein